MNVSLKTEALLSWRGQVGDSMFAASAIIAVLAFMPTSMLRSAKILSRTRGQLRLDPVLAHGRNRRARLLRSQPCDRNVRAQQLRTDRVWLGPRPGRLPKGIKFKFSAQRSPCSRNARTVSLQKPNRARRRAGRVCWSGRSIRRTSLAPSTLYWTSTAEFLHCAFLRASARALNQRGSMTEPRINCLRN